jgi:hypothetical protein
MRFDGGPVGVGGCAVDAFATERCMNFIVNRREDICFG